MTLSDLRVGQDIATLLREDARNTIAVMSMSRVQDTHILGTYSKLLCSLNAIGASGWMMMLHVFGTSTSRIAFRLTFLEFDRDPSVATSLSLLAEC